MVRLKYNQQIYWIFAFGMNIEHTLLWRKMWILNIYSKGGRCEHWRYIIKAEDVNIEYTLLRRKMLIYWIYILKEGDGNIEEITLETFRVVFGDNITIDCSVSSHPAVTSIQWQWNTTDGLVDIIIDDHIYSGATTMEPSLIISAANFTHIGMYRCIGANGSVSSFSAISQLYQDDQTYFLCGEIMTIW
jgi:hypothetical protein